jgi:hypothetical protein
MMVQRATLSRILPGKCGSAARRYPLQGIRVEKRRTDLSFPKLQQPFRAFGPHSPSLSITPPLPFPSILKS